MQEILNNNWNKIIGLEKGKKYKIQATIMSDVEREEIKVLFAQQETEPTSDKDGLLTDLIQVVGDVNVYVKSFATPYYINFYEVL